MAVDLRHFRCFAAVAEELHFHRAAKKLGVAQPALSRTIRNLENELGVTLFRRTNRQVAITPAGQSLLKGCREVLTKTDQIIEDVKRAHEGKIGILRVGYTDNAINGIAPAMLKRFQHLHPDIELRLTHIVTANQLVGLNDGSFDFGFGTGSVARPGFEHLCIQSEAFVCVVYDGHPLAGRDSLNIADLAHEPFVQGNPAQWEHFHSYLSPLFRRAGFEPNVVQEGLTTSDILRLVSCGMGLSILTESVVDTLPSGLRVIPLKGATDRLDTVLVWKNDSINNAKTHFISFFKQAFTAPELLQGS